jgi:hypothetical protein
MTRGLAFPLIGFAALLTLAGCGRGFMQFAQERAPWRHEAEVACLKSGAVKISDAVTQADPIEGPGMCGADFPLKVAALGEDRVAMGYGDELRPPGAIPNGAQPRWPIREPANVAQPRLQWSVGPQPVEGTAGAPMSIVPPGANDPAPQAYEPRPYEPGPYEPRGGQSYEPRGGPSYEPRRYEPVATRPAYPQRAYEPPAAAPRDERADDIPDDAVLPNRRAAPQPRYSPQASREPQQEPIRREMPRSVPNLGPMRGPAVTGSTKVELKPKATLACPMVSALDQWVSEAVQPAAMKWFGQPVVEIKQISAYSCRGMVGASGHHISEHAFGNALDVAGFVLADGRKIIVKSSWNGAPEETGFLHDIQMAACDKFTTVLAPGYNVYHYNHIHLDLMRRRNGRTACRPNPISGEVAAARALQKTKYARRDPGVTGSIGKGGSRADNIAGEDGLFDDDDDDTTGSIGPSSVPLPAPRITRPSPAVNTP